MQSAPVMPQNAVYIGSSLDFGTKLVSVSDRWKEKKIERKRAYRFHPFLW